MLASSVNASNLIKLTEILFENQMRFKFHLYSKFALFFNLNFMASFHISGEILSIFTTSKFELSYETQSCVWCFFGANFHLMSLFVELSLEKSSRPIIFKAHYSKKKKEKNPKIFLGSFAPKDPIRGLASPPPFPSPTTSSCIC